MSLLLTRLFSVLILGCVLQNLINPLLIWGKQLNQSRFVLDCTPTLRLDVWLPCSLYLRQHLPLPGQKYLRLCMQNKWNYTQRIMWQILEFTGWCFDIRWFRRRLFLVCSEKCDWKMAGIFLRTSWGPEVSVQVAVYPEGPVLFVHYYVIPSQSILYISCDWIEQDLNLWMMWNNPHRQTASSFFISSLIHEQRFCVLIICSCCASFPRSYLLKWLCQLQNVLTRL